MKRSEMVKIIATAHSRFDCCGHPYDYDDLAEYLLSSIEGAGMLPPKRTIRQEGHYSGPERIHKKENITLRSWEPEDETK